MADIRGIAMAGVAACCLALSCATNGPRQNSSGAPVPWPTRGWERATPESEGFDSGILADAFDFARAKQLPVHSLVIVRNGRLIVDSYFFPFHEGETHDVASVTKSVTSTLIGIAVGEGRIGGVRTPILPLFPEYQVAHRDARKDAMTVEDFLTMTSGLDCKRMDAEITLRQMTQQPDWVKFMLDLPMVAQPGQQYSYCSGGMHVLSGVLSHATGMSALDYARRVLFAPLGISVVAWPADPHGITHGWGDLHLQPRDMAKIGYLWLNGGRWENRQIIPADWMRDAVREHSRADWGDHQPYGYGMWLKPEGAVPLFEAVGRGSQRITVIPGKNIVVVVTGGQFEPGDIGGFILRALKSDAPIPENPAAQRRLAAAIVAAAAAPAPSMPASTSPTAAKISGRRFALDNNRFGIRTVQLDFVGDSATISFESSDGRAETHPIGLRGVPSVSPNGRFDLPVAITGRWETPDAFAVRYDEVGNINDVRLRFTFSGDALDLDLSEMSGLGHERVRGRPEPAKKPGV